MTEPDSTFLFESITKHFDQKLPFAVYNKPNAKMVIGMFQTDDVLYHVENYTEAGFVFAAFEDNEIVLIPKNKSQIVVADFEVFRDFTSDLQWHEMDENENQLNFTNLVQKGIDAIHQGDFGKVVLSRKETVVVSNFELTNVFQKLLHAYPTAFTYCFFHPKVGLWLGAFSEQLIRVKNKTLYTMAVAGTQLYEENKTVVWESKEQTEQQFVTDFITQSLNDYVSETKISAPYTMKAGNLIHIKTDIEAALNTTSTLKEVLAILHPTPAVCGFPKEVAEKFILKNEGYHREYYAGFLGEFNLDIEKQENNTDLYVNLRCMKVENNEVNLYVGCGITKDSIPEKEWLETVNKSKTIKKVLH